jgi:hypothetical protein
MSSFANTFRSVSLNVMLKDVINFLKNNEIKE